METKRQFTLLLVDDNPTNVLLLVKIIELDLPEVRVLTASSALEGLELAEQESVDGAFIDVQMSQMGGLEMCRQLRSKPQTATIPLVLMTAHVASPQMRAEGLEVGAYDFISQPISNVEMLARIKVMLRLCKSEQRSLENNQQLQQQVMDHEDRLRWVSGLLVSGDGPLATLDQKLLRHLSDELPDPARIDDKLFFEKLATEFPLPWRRTLLKLALLDTIPLPLAQKISEIVDVAAVFDYLSRHQLSLKQTDSGIEYLLLSLQTRDLLRQKAEQDLDEIERQQVYLTAAEWYRQQEDYPAVLRCLVSAGQYSAVSQLLSQLGLTLLDKHYDSQILPQINRIPESVAETCGWLSLFQGINHLQQPSLGAEEWLELAYQHFQTAEDARGLLLTLNQQAYHMVLFGQPFECWFDRLKFFRKLAADQLALIEPVERLKIAYTSGLAELFFAGDLNAVEKILATSLAEAQQLQLPEQQMELNLLRSLFALQQGRYLVARTALEQGLKLSLDWGHLVPNSLLQVSACSLLHASGQLDELLQQRKVLTECCGGDIQKHTGISALLGYYIANLLLSCGEQQRALETLEVALLDGQAINNLQMQNRLLQFRGWVKALLGQEAAALSDLERGINLRRQAGGTLYYIENLLVAGATCFALQRFDQAAEYLTEGLAESKRNKEERFRTGLHAWLAVVQKRCGDLVGAAEQVKDFLEQLKRHRVNYFIGLVPELLSELQPLITRKAEQILLQPVLEGRLLTAYNGENQQVPLLRVRCLGGFQLQLQREIFDLSLLGQASRQILALLIIAPNHTLSIELVMGVLWPDSSPRKARNSFDTAHSRLRKALEKCFGKQIRREYLVLQKGMLALHYVQIDSVLFSEAMKMARYHLQRDNFWQAEHALWKMERLWQGEFLSGYDLDGDLPFQREQLTQLRLEQLCMLAQLLQKRQQQEESTGILRQGLLLDPTYDPIIRQLLSLYRQRQDSHTADLLLKNYRTALQYEDYELEEIEELIEALGT
ncbi:MAG: response regulator [Thermodesulfobacteriota bacterium]|nr:response regulator [Thermodesulfobacteriota bacterium]